MTTYTGTITDGSATIEIDTSSMSAGAYDVSTTYTQNNKYSNASKNSLLTLTGTSTVITDDCTTTNNWLASYQSTAATTATQDGRTVVSPGYNNQNTGNNYWKYPIDLTSSGTVSYYIYMTGNYTSFGLCSAIGRSNEKMLRTIQYTPLWSGGKWGICTNFTNTTHFGSSMSTGNWHKIEFDYNQRNITIKVDDSTIDTRTIPTISDNNLCNEYLFPYVINMGNNMYVRDVSYAPASVPSDSLLAQIRSAHESQFNGGG